MLSICVSPFLPCKQVYQPHFLKYFKVGWMEKVAWTYIHHAFVLSCFSCAWLCARLWTVAHQTSLSMRFSRQECWSVLPFPPPEDLPDPGIEPASPALPVGFFTTCVTWEAHIYTTICKIDSWWEVAVQHREPRPVLCDDLGVWEWLWGIDSGGRWYMSKYGWFALLYGRNQHKHCKAIFLQLKSKLKK